MSYTATLSAEFAPASRRPLAGRRLLASAFRHVLELCREVDAHGAIEATLTLGIAVGAMAAIASLV